MVGAKEEMIASRASSPWLRSERTSDDAVGIVLAKSRAAPTVSSAPGMSSFVRSIFSKTISIRVSNNAISDPSLKALAVGAANGSNHAAALRKPDTRHTSQVN